MQSILDIVFEPFKTTDPRCGCYANNQDLLQQRHNQVILVPLKSSEYHLEIVNSIVNVNLTQHYHNPTSKFLEIQYSFPINPEACVYKFTAEFGKMRIQGIVKEKEEAKKEYRQAIREGKKAAYGELDDKSKDIMNLKVGNVPPNQSVRIEISYLQELTLANNTFYQLHMVGTISPRYMSHIPAEKLRVGLRNETARAKGDFYWNYTINLKTSRKNIFFDSHTHDLELFSQNDSKTQTLLGMAGKSIPNKDFFFTFTTENFQLPSSVLGKTDTGSTAMLSFIPKFCNMSIDDAYKASVSGKTVQTEIENARGQYIFLLDRSGSMGMGRMEKAKDALILFIKSLPQDTYFNVASFGTNFEFLFPESVIYSDEWIKEAIQKIKMMKSNFGGTQIFKPLEKLITKSPLKGYPRQIFLLTDGGVYNTTEVVHMVGRNCKYSRVHTIGVGNGCSQELIMGCAKKGKGYHVFMGDNEDTSEKIIQLLSDSLSPVISKFDLTFDKDLVESVIPNPESMPAILKNQIVNFYVTFKGHLPQKTVFNFSYQDSINKMPFKSEITIDPQVESESFVDKMGHFKRIRLLEDSFHNNINVEDLMFYVKEIDTKIEIINQSVKHQILSQFTAFLCVEKELLDGTYQQIKDKGQVKVQVQNPQPIESGQDRVWDQLAVQSASYRMLDLDRSSMRGSKRAQNFNFGPMAARSRMVEEISECSYDLRESEQVFDGRVHLQSAQLYTRSSGQKKGCCSGGSSRRATTTPYRHHAPNRNNISQMSLQEDIYEQSEQPSLNIDQQLPSPKQMKLERQIPEIEVKADLKQSKGDKGVNINQVVALQTAQGSWSDIELIGLLFGKDVQEEVANEKELTVVVTYLISRWIEKNYPGTQFHLVVKKGLNFVKKDADNLDEFDKLYGKYIK